MSFTRGPSQRGNTAAPIVAQPRITGTVRRDNSGEIASLPLPSTLSVESELGGPVEVTFSTSRALNTLLTEINTALVGVATAEDRDGCLSLVSAGSGDGAFIRIKRATSGFDDAAGYFGFMRDPHPRATVAAGDIERAEVRPGVEANPEGTSLVADGSDRLPRSFNRSLLRLIRNADHLYALLTNSVAAPLVVDVDPTDPAWVARLILDADGNVEQVDLSDLESIDARLAGRVFVGGLTGSSSLTEISQYFKVLDGDDNEIVAANDRIVRVAAVTRGQRVAGVPTFSDDWTAPGSPLADTAAAAPDGGNALGVDLTKSAAAAITEVLDRSTIIVDGAAFESDGVLVGDLVTISSSGIDSPVNHNGVYVVEHVVDEDELVLRPVDPESSGDLNPGPGILGDAAVHSGGEFQDNVWVSFSPPIPPQQLRGGVAFRLVIGIERSVGLLHAENEALLRIAVRGASETDGFAMRDIHRQLNFGGVYDGHAPRTQRGAGGWGTLTRPISLELSGTDLPDIGTLDRTVAAGATDGVYLTAGGADEFTQDDVGRVFHLTGGTLPAAGLPCLAISLDGNKRIRLRRLDVEEGADLPTEPTVAYSIYDDAFHEFPAAMLIRSVSSDADVRSGGLAALHEQTDTGKASNDEQGWYALCALERVVLAGGNNVLSESATLSGNDVLELSFDPTDQSAIFGSANDKITAGSSETHATLVRVLQGPEAGWYRTADVRSSTVSGTDALQVTHLDGSAVVWGSSYDSAIAFYNVAFGVNVPTETGRWSGLRAFVDWHQSGNTDQPGVLSASWRGGGSSAAGILMHPNDWDLVAYDNGDGAQGWCAYFTAAPPMEGAAHLRAFGATTGARARRRGQALRIVASTNTMDRELDAAAPVSSSDLGVGAWVHQAGKDPAIIVTWTPGGAFALPTLGEAANAGLGFLGMTGTVWGAGHGLDVNASIWLHHTRNLGGLLWAPSSLIVDTVVAGGRALYPGTHDETISFLGTDGHVNYDAPTQLGQPALLLPFSSALGALSFDVYEPDFSVFNQPHAGYLDWQSAGVAIQFPLESLLGARVRITSSGDEYRIIAIAGVQFLALEGAVTIAADDTVEAEILGNRWRESFVDIADWFQIGTFGLRDAPALAPLVTIAVPAADSWADVGVPLASVTGLWQSSALTGTVTGIVGAVVTGDGSSSFDTEVAAGDWFKVTADDNWAWTRVLSVDSATQLTLVRDYEGSASGNSSVSSAADAKVALNLDSPTGLSPASLLLTPHLAGVGRYSDAMPSVVAGDPTAWADEWVTDLQEPRAPVPNMGIVASGAFTSDGDASHGIPEGTPLLSKNYQGNLEVDGAVLEIRAMESADGVFAGYSYFMGGCLAVWSADAAPTAAVDKIRLWLRGQGALNSRFLKARARVVVWRPGTSPTDDLTVTASLRDSYGRIVHQASGAAAVISAGATPELVEFEFENTDFLSSPSDIWNRAEDTGELHLVLDFQFENSTAAYFGYAEFLDLTKPSRHYGPAEIAGLHRATAYRLLRPRHGFDTIGPGRIDLLEFAEYARTFVRSSDGENDEDYVEEQGVGLLNDGSHWLRPTYTKSSFFTKSPHAATITVNHPFFDPLWYSYASGLQAAVAGGGGGYSTYRDKIVWPGRTGFMAEVDVPHGAVLSSLKFVMSLSPCYSRNSDNLVTKFQVWNDWESNTGDLLGTTHESGSVTAWDDDQGYIIRVWRKHVLDHGIEDPATNKPTGAGSSLAGWAEVIWTQYVPLPAGTEPDGSDNSNFGSEHVVRGSYNLLDSIGVAHAHKLRADRRHFAYFVTIEFWCGMRDIAASNYWYSTSAPPWLDVSDAGAPRVLNSYEFTAVKHQLRGLDAGDGTASGVPSPGAIKLRGVRVGWMTDRLGRGWEG